MYRILLLSSCKNSCMCKAVNEIADIKMDMFLKAIKGVMRKFEMMLFAVHCNLSPSLQHQFMKRDNNNNNNNKQITLNVT